MRSTPPPVRHGAARLLGGAVLLALAACAGPARREPALVHFPTRDGGVTYADVYGSGPRAVVLAHGGRFARASWADQAPVLANAGLRVVAIDFRGRGRSRGGPGREEDGEYVVFDVLAAVDWLRTSGAESVAVVGASFGGWAAAEVAALGPGTLDRLVLLGAGAEEPERIGCATLFVVTRDDVRGGGVPRLPEIREDFERVAGPKQLLVLEGSAHAQYVFETDQGERALRAIVGFVDP